MPPHQNNTIENMLHPDPDVRSNVDYIPLDYASPFYKDLGRRATTLLIETLTDPLTGLPNEKAFTASLEASAERENSQFSIDGEETNMAVLYIDVDGFKAVNDTLGHQAGDKVLTIIGSALRSGIRDADVATHSEPEAKNKSEAAREHGDEFKVLVRDIVGSSTVNMTKGERLEAMTSRIREVVNLALQNSEYNGQLSELGVGLSVGAEIYRRHENIEEFIKRADAAMRIDKAARKAAR